MKKTEIYVATIIDSYNYGTVLQAVATRGVLDKFGDTKFVDYRRAYWTNAELVKRCIRGTSNPIKGMLSAASQMSNRIISHKIFRPFVEHHLPLCPSGNFENGGDFSKDAIYCVGSDQTWNYECNEGVDPVFFLKNVPDECVKISYAASFGRSELLEEEKEEVQRLLRRFTAISLREPSGAKLLESIGIAGGVVIHDPVLLCGRNMFEELAEQAPQNDSRPYVLVYQLNKGQTLLAYADKLAKTAGCNVVKISLDWKERLPEGWRKELFPSVERWVSLFRDASYVVTDSFHGTCFSLLFHKSLGVFDPPKYSVRLHDVLRDFDMMRRLLSAYDGEPPLLSSMEEVDWDVVDSQFVQYQEYAYGWLQEVLSSDGR